jgi:hypothetical protein
MLAETYSIDEYFDKCIETNANQTKNEIPTQRAAKTLESRPDFRYYSQIPVMKHRLITAARID